MMAYLTTGWIVFYIFAAIWLFGWIASVRETSIGQEPWGFFKIRGIILLFFIWPYIAWCMMNQGDI
jgi:hypothetical protein